MINEQDLTIVFGFRGRDRKRAERCVGSLRHQTFQNFEVIFVDYGSSLSIAQAARKVVKRHEFCRYIYSDTRGYP